MAPVQIDTRDAVAIVTIDNPPVNALSNAVRAGLLEAMDAAETDADVEAVVIHGAGRNFIAGADIREFDQGLKPPHTPEVVARIEALDKPVVAAIHGHALGGGLEIALGCHGRVAASDALIGFPEVRLGLIPGASGTQRLPRLVGIEAALEFMLAGRPVDAARANELDLIDCVAAADDLLDAAIEHARGLAAREEPLRRIRELPVAAVAPDFFAAYRKAMAARTRGQFAPDCIFQSVENALTMPFDEAVVAERELFMRCMASPQSKALRYAFFAERLVSKPPEFAIDAEPLAISTVAIVGAGTMGVGIAQSCLAAGFDVLLQDISDEQLDSAHAKIAKIFDAAVAKGRMDRETGAALLAKLRTSSDPGDLASADLVIEAVYENLDLKRGIFAELDRICPASTLLATNTSTLDVDAVAAVTRRPQDVLGLHFFSPAHVMRLIEIVRAECSSPVAVATGVAFAKQLGKLGVVVGNAHGFVGNRMFHSYGREAQSLLLEGASPEQIDRALVDWGMAMGPHAVGDLAGLDVGYKIRRERGGAQDDPGYFRVADVLAEAGRYGQKSGAGMYRYAPGSREPQPDPEVTRIIEREAAALGIERREIGDAEIVERCIYALIVEGARLLEGGIASRPSDIDVIWLNGYGFPRHRGGPMYYADSVGLNRVRSTVREFAARFGERYWAPPRVLEDLTRRGGRFHDLAVSR
ncbi:MAG: 3-hydroxyacyl-CoA dehydrogenase [Gammaproteobacteria bacterium]|nr:3-hydroxyacyl-CoA dehydrogenase [Gammaproteobacteria bacterium]